MVHSDIVSLSLSHQLVMVDTRQNKIFATRDEGVTFVGYNLNFTPNKIKFQGRTVPRSTEGTLPLHIMGYEIQREAVCVCLCVCVWVHVSYCVDTQLVWCVVVAVECDCVSTSAYTAHTRVAPDNVAKVFSVYCN